MTTPVPICDDRTFKQTVLAWIKPTPSALTRPHFKSLFLVLFAIATYFAVFRLPFLFPPSAKTLSASYSAGFSNQVAVVAAALLACLCFLATWKFGVGNKALGIGQHPPLSRALLRCAWLVYLGLYVLLAISIYHNVRYYVDNAYFRERLEQMELYGRLPYRDFGLGYGPLMVYLPLAIKKLTAPFHLTLQSSFDVSLIAMALAGLWMVFKLVDALVADRKYKQVVFVFFSMVGLNVCMAMNYTFFRFATPYYALLILDRIVGKTGSAIALIVASTAVMAISPEVGIAFSCGATAYYVFRARSRDWPWLLIAPLAWSGIAVLVACCGPEYVSWLAGAGVRGYYFLVVAPVPHIILFLVALVFIVPIGMARLLKSADEHKSMLLAFCATALVMLPTTFGTADCIHVFFNGFGILLLSFAFAANFSEARRMIWTMALAAVFCYGDFCMTLGFVPHLATAAERDLTQFLPQQTAHATVAKLLTEIPLFETFATDDWGTSHDSEAVDDAELATIPGRGAISTPFLADWKTDRALKTAGRYSPSYWFGFMGLPDAQSELKKIHEMDSTEWALIPIHPDLYRLNRGMVQLIYMFPVNYVDKREGFEPGLILLSRMDTDWKRIRSIGRYWLYHNRRYVESASAVATAR